VAVTRGRAATYDQRAEQSVIGAILHAPNLFADLGDLKPEHFFIPAHELLFSTMQEMHAAGEDIDSITVFARLSESNELRKVGGAPYLSDLLQAFKSADNVASYADIVRAQYKIRRINQLGVQLQTIDADADEVPVALDRVRQFLEEAEGEQQVGGVDFTGLYDAWSKWNESDTVVVETPWPAMNNYLNGGLMPGRMVLIGARPGNGKTIMGTQMALYAAQLHKKALVFSMELSKEDMAGRILSCGAHIPYREVTSRRLTPESYQKVSQWVAASANMSLTVDDSTDLTIEDIAQRCRIHQAKHGLDVVLIDYVGLVAESRGSGDNRVQRVDHIAKKARQIAKDLGVAVILLAQLNRSIESGALPGMGLFRESGGLEQTADVAMILARPPDENGEEQDNIPLLSAVIVKNRQGTNGVVTFRERFDQARLDA
jgi:replicative DNA helicase